MTSLDSIREDIRKAQEVHRARPEMMRGLKVPYYRRGEMSIPAIKIKPGADVATEGRQQSLRLMSKAAQFPIDFFFYDLEDAAPDNPEFKVFARQFLVEALKTNDYGNRVVGFRPSNIRTKYFEDDMIEVLSNAGDRLNALVLPKTEYADEVKDVVKIIKDIQRLKGFDNQISVEVLIESPRGFLEAEKIAAIDGVAALIFGAWDFARTIGGKVTPDGWIHDQAVARQMLPIIAGAYGKDAVDAVTGTLPIRPKCPEGISVEDYKAALQLHSSAIDVAKFGQGFVDTMKKKERALDLVRRDAEDARAIGYAAKWILHPDQIEPVHAAWTPSRENALEALELTAHYTRAALSGSGAEVDNDRLADKAVIGTEWWRVQAGLRAGVIGDEDISATGFTFEELLRTVVTHDEHVSLK